MGRVGSDSGASDGAVVSHLAVACFVFGYAPLASVLSGILLTEIDELVLFGVYVFSAAILTALVTEIIDVEPGVFAAMTIIGPVVGFAIVAFGQGGTLFHPAPIFVGGLFVLGHLLGLGLHLSIRGASTN